MQIYTVKEAAKILRVDAHKIYDLIGRGLITPLRLGRLKIPDYELERFVKENQGKQL